MGPEMLAQIDLRLRQIMENDLLFGEIPQVHIGDFFQTPPVAPTKTLYNALLDLFSNDSKLNPNKTFKGPAKQGARLFATFRKIELTKQMRATNDPTHIAFLSQLRHPTTKQQQKLTESLQKLKVITRQDVEKQPTWMNAPIVVTSNEECFRINEQQFIALPMQRKCPRIVWYQPILGLVANAIDQTQVNYLYASSHQLK